MVSISFASITGIMAWVGGNHVMFLDGDEKLPYCLKNGMYNYFGYDGKQYNLIMKSDRDLQEKQA